MVVKRKLQAGYTVVELLITIALGTLILGLLALGGGMVYVVIHFIAKVW